MVCGEILVVPDDAPECEERVDIGFRFTARHDARVVGRRVEKEYRLPRIATTRLPSTNANDPCEFRAKACERVRGRFERQAAALHSSTLPR